MFCGCESLLYINMSNLDLSKVDDATYMFYNMKEINYPEIKGIKLNDKINEELKGEYGLNNKETTSLVKTKTDEHRTYKRRPSYCSCQPKLYFQQQLYHRDELCLRQVRRE